MKTIWKYIIRPNDSIHEIPSGGHILYVAEQFGDICIWVEVDPLLPKEKRHFEVYATGHSINDTGGFERIYLGSIQLNGGALVFHIYEYMGEEDAND